MELTFIRGLYDGSGPWASVYLDASRHTDQARAAVRIRWKDLRASLRAQDVDDPTLQALESELIDDRTLRALGAADVAASPQPGRHGLAMFAAGGEVRYTEVLTEPPAQDVAEVSPLPHVTPLLSARGEQVPWLRVTVDRVGGDIERPEHETIQAEGHNLFPIRKTHGGGWSQENLQRKAELRWQHNAREVAVAVSELAESSGVELLVVAGDVRARQLLIGALPERWQERVVEVDGGSRAPGADPTAVETVTRQAVGDVVARRRAAVVDRLLNHRAEYAAVGVPAVVAAFDRGQVDTLLLDPDGMDGLDGLIRASALTDADVVLVSPDDVSLPEGVGAILRYVDQSTVHN